MILTEGPVVVMLVGWGRECLEYAIDATNATGKTSQMELYEQPSGCRAARLNASRRVRAQRNRGRSPDQVFSRNA